MKAKKFAPVIIALVGLSAMLLAIKVGLVGAQTASLSASQVTGNLQVDGVANEAFWSTTTGQTFTTTYTPGSDQIPGGVSVTMKAATNGTDLFLLFTWSDTTESRQRLGDASFEDRLAVMMEIPGGTPMDSPCMQASSNGAVTSGTADQWHWKAGRTDGEGANHVNLTRNDVAFNTGDVSVLAKRVTDNAQVVVPAHSAVYLNTNNTSAGYNLTDLGGVAGDQVYYIPGNVGNARWAISTSSGAVPLNVASHPYSYAENEFMNTTARYRSGDSEYTFYGVKPSVFSSLPRYLIQAKGEWASGVWTLEMRRKLADANATVDLSITAGATIKFALAMYDGNYSHDHERKYITTWKTLALTGPSGIPGYPVYIVGGLVVVMVAILVHKKMPKIVKAIP